MTLEQIGVLTTILTLLLGIIVFHIARDRKIRKNKKKDLAITLIISLYHYIDWNKPDESKITPVRHELNNVDINKNINKKIMEYTTAISIYVRYANHKPKLIGLMNTKKVEIDKLKKELLDEL